jgi:hypothetical protein
LGSGDFLILIKERGTFPLAAQRGNFSAAVFHPQNFKPSNRKAENNNIQYEIEKNSPAAEGHLRF